MRGYFGAACAAIALLCAPVQASCWSDEEAAAARVRELQSVLMVAALRCQIAKHDMTADYNRFLIANRATIQMLNERLKTHFIHAAGPVKGQTAYDAFATMLANGHGAEASGNGECGAMASLAREAALMAGSVEGLLLLTTREGLTVALPEEACGAPPATVMAQAATGAPAPVVMAAMQADVPPAPAPVLVAAIVPAAPVPTAPVVGQPAVFAQADVAPPAGAAAPVQPTAAAVLTVASLSQ